MLGDKFVVAGRKDAKLRRVAGMLSVAALYFLAARLGLLLAFDKTNASPVWPAAGVALGALRILGSRFWPGIFLGAFLANLLVFFENHVAPPLPILAASAGIALGNALEAVAGVWLLRRWLGGRNPLDQPGDVFGFGLVALGMSVVSASNGPLITCALGLAPWPAWPMMALTWWLGDATGVLTVAPLALIWRRERFRVTWTPTRAGEAALAFLALVGVTGVIFNPSWLGGDWRQWKYFSLAPLLWIALRFDRRETALAFFFFSAVAVWGTIREPAAIGTLPLITEMLGLQSFIGFTGLTTLAIAAAVAERKDVEESLRVVVEAAPNGMVKVDAKGQISLVNAQMEGLFGYTRAELLGQPIELLIPERYRSRHPELRKEFMTHLQARPMGAGRDLFGRRKDGSEFPVEIGLNPIQTARGQFVLASVIDITTRKQEEKQARDLLEATVAERTLALQATLNSMEELLYTIAHDLRSPNRAMAGFAQLLQLHCREQLDNTARDYLDRISAAAGRNDQLIDDLLAYGRLSHEAVTLGPIDSRETVEAVLQALESEIQQRHARVHLGQEWPRVLANEPMLKQILTNLLTNALKYVPSDKHPEVEISAKRHDSKVLLRVKDNGIGISPDQIEKIFKPFMRLPNGLEVPGTGIGLAIVKKAAERMQGQVALESTPGLGSCFWVELRAA